MKTIHAAVDFRFGFAIPRSFYTCRYVINILTLTRFCCLRDALLSMALRSGAEIRPKVGSTKIPENIFQRTNNKHNDTGVPDRCLPANTRSIRHGARRTGKCHACEQTDNVAEVKETFQASKPLSKADRLLGLRSWSAFKYILYLLGPLADELDQRIINLLWVRGT